MSLILEEAESLFASPLVRFRVAGHEVLDAALLHEGERLRAASEGARKSNQGGWHSAGNLFDEDAPSIGRLRALVEEAVATAMTRIEATPPKGATALKLFGWMNANPPRGFNAPHTHPGAHWSGTYYLRQPEVDEGRSGMIEFLDPRSDLAGWSGFGGGPFRSKKRLRPVPGEMILFPSWLTHWVYPNDSAEERWSIAFNATFRKPPKRQPG